MVGLVLSLNSKQQSFFSFIYSSNYSINCQKMLLYKIVFLFLHSFEANEYAKITCVNEFFNAVFGQKMIEKKSCKGMFVIVL